MNFHNSGATVYLAGPIGAVTTKEATDWRGYATERLEAAGIRVLDPCRGKDLDAWHKDKSIYDPEAVVKRDLDDVARANVLLVDASKDVPVWGTAAEAFYAWLMGKEVVVWGIRDDIPLWLDVYTRQHGAAFLTLKEAVEHVIGEYSWGGRPC